MTAADFSVKSMTAIEKNLAVGLWSSRAIRSRDLYDRLRCDAVNDIFATSVSNADWMPPIERQQSGALTHRFF
jgi:hypothetical protein